MGTETTAAQIVHLIESAPVGETRIQNYAERFGDRLVLPSLLLSGSFYAATRNVDRLLSMLIVDYGTGIRVAAPTAVLAAMTHAARQGILIKSGAHMERLAAVHTIVFDKTGTLTHGVPQVQDVVSYDERLFPERKILELAAAAEARLKHPVSKALLSKAQADGIAIPERQDSHFEIGLGVEARINGYCVHVGNERFFSQNSIRTGASAASVAAASEKGWSTLLFAVDGVLKGLIPYADGVRRESRNVVQTLRNAGIKDVVMITGHNKLTAQAVSSQLGITQCFAETLPAYEAELVRELQSKGRVVAMVGDGINDSAALAYADVGIAMKHGADVAREMADVVLMEDNLWKLVAAVEISTGDENGSAKLWNHCRAKYTRAFVSHSAGAYQPEHVGSYQQRLGHSCQPKRGQARTGRRLSRQTLRAGRPGEGECPAPPPYPTRSRTPFWRPLPQFCSNRWRAEATACGSAYMASNPG